MSVIESKQLLMTVPGSCEVRKVPLERSADQMVLRMLACVPSLGTTMFVYSGSRGGIPHVRNAPWQPRPAPVAQQFQPRSVSGTGIWEVIETVPDGPPVGAWVRYGGAMSHAVARPPLQAAPSDVPPERSTWLHQGSVALNAVRRARIVLGDSVLVVGMGGIGQITAQMARMAGAHQVIGADVAPRKLEIALETGCDAVVNMRESDLGEAVKALTDGRGADEAFVTVPFAEVMNPVQDAAAFMARIIVVALFRNEHDHISLSGDFHFKQLEIISVQTRFWPPGDINHTHRWTTDANYAYMEDLLRRELVNVDALVTHRFTIDESAELFRIATESPDEMLGALITP
jgi:threonine dehydrogenase-like Zn-dependent dehydrogenase